MTDDQNRNPDDEVIVFSDMKITWTEPDEDGVGQRTAEPPGTFTYRRTTADGEEQNR